MTTFTEMIKRFAYVLVMMYGTISFVTFVLTVNTLGKDPSAPWFVVAGLAGMYFTYRATEQTDWWYK